MHTGILSRFRCNEALFYTNPLINQPNLDQPTKHYCIRPAISDLI